MTAADGGEEREVAWLRRLRDLSQRLASEWDARALLPLILDAAIELARAERGYLVRVQGANADGGLQLEVVEARGFDQTTLRGAEGKVSRTVVRRVLEQPGDGLVTTREQEILDVSSVQARRVVAIACVPLRLRGQTLGVLYLDHRHDPAAFSARDLPVLAAFADQAAMALSTAELLGERARSAEALDAALAELRAARAALDAHERASSQAPAPERASFGRLVGGSPVMRALYEELEPIAAAKGPVLVLGEAGAGKTAVARELHARGAGPGAPPTLVGCAGPGVEDELFGPRGALAGGRGTVVLGEVADLSPPLQARLLRALQAEGPRPRVIATSRADLPERVHQGLFRADLYYRLDVLRVVVPPLRQRREDIPLLLAHFGQQAGRRLLFTPRALELLMGYAWPGNVRQLENEALRLILSPAPQVTAQELSDEVREGRGVTGAPERLAGRTLDEVERSMVEAALRDCQGNKARAARQLGIPRSTLYGLLVRYGL